MSILGYIYYILACAQMAILLTKIEFNYRYKRNLYEGITNYECFGVVVFIAVLFLDTINGRFDLKY